MGHLDASATLSACGDQSTNWNETQHANGAVLAAALCDDVGAVARLICSVGLTS
jgi:hypothetical protein